MILLAWTKRSVAFDDQDLQKRSVLSIFFLIILFLFFFINLSYSRPARENCGVYYYCLKEQHAFQILQFAHGLGCEFYTREQMNQWYQWAIYTGPTYWPQVKVKGQAAQSQSQIQGQPAQSAPSQDEAPTEVQTATPAGQALQSEINISQCEGQGQISVGQTEGQGEMAEGQNTPKQIVPSEPDKPDTAVKIGQGQSIEVQGQRVEIEGQGQTPQAEGQSQPDIANQTMAESMGASKAEGQPGGQTEGQGEMGWQEYQLQYKAYLQAQLKALEESSMGEEQKAQYRAYYEAQLDPSKLGPEELAQFQAQYQAYWQAQQRKKPAKRRTKHKK